MISSKIHFKATANTPEILLTSEGIFRIKGRAIDEKITKVHDQVMNWIDSYLHNPRELTEFIVALEYLNSYNTLIVTSILKKVSQVVKKGKKLVIHWYYEEDDVDIFDRGQNISSAINLPFEFILTNNIKSV
jgi:hypothetical protein